MSWLNNWLHLRVRNEDVLSSISNYLWNYEHYVYHFLQFKFILRINQEIYVSNSIATSISTVTSVWYEGNKLSRYLKYINRVINLFYYFHNLQCTSELIIAWLLIGTAIIGLTNALSSARTMLRNVFLTASTCHSFWCQGKESVNFLYFYWYII